MQKGTPMSDPILRDPFAAASLPPALRWHCEPERWSLHPAEGLLRVEPDAATDFWQKTHYGFAADNGHFLYRDVAGDFVLTAQARFRPVHQYDQAGVMARVSPSCWLKASVEYEPDGPARLGAVVTNLSYSDWSTQDFPAGDGQVWLRVRREADDYRAWTQIRVAHLHEGRGLPIAAGIYACSPKAAGFVADFTEFTIHRGRLPARPPSLPA
jgi:regulation of enolase protein 1 (concanavalin A-like superfamily)